MRCPDRGRPPRNSCPASSLYRSAGRRRSEEHTSELQSPCNLVCRLLLEKKKQADLPPQLDRDHVYRPLHLQPRIPPSPTRVLHPCPYQSAPLPHPSQCLEPACHLALPVI